MKKPIFTALLTLFIAACDNGLFLRVKLPCRKVMKMLSGV